MVGWRAILASNEVTPATPRTTARSATNVASCMPRSTAAKDPTLESDDARHGQPETPSATEASDWQLGRSSLGWLA